MLAVNFCVDCFHSFVSTLPNTPGTFKWSSIVFFRYICRKFLLVPFLQKVSPPSCQGDICAQAPSPHVSVCFPSLSDSDPHKFHICLRLLSPHMQHQTEADSLSPWSRPFPHSPPTAQRVWLLY